MSKSTFTPTIATNAIETSRLHEWRKIPNQIPFQGRKEEI